MHNVLYTYVL